MILLSIPILLQGHSEAKHSLFLLKFDTETLLDLFINLQWEFEPDQVSSRVYDLLYTYIFSHSSRLMLHIEGFKDASLALLVVHLLDRFIARYCLKIFVVISTGVGLLG